MSLNSRLDPASLWGTTFTLKLWRSSSMYCWLLVPRFCLECLLVQAFGTSVPSSTLKLLQDKSPIYPFFFSPFWEPLLLHKDMWEFKSCVKWGKSWFNSGKLYFFLNPHEGTCKTSPKSPVPVKIIKLSPEQIYLEKAVLV